MEGAEIEWGTAWVRAKAGLHLVRAMPRSGRCAGRESLLVVGDCSQADVHTHVCCSKPLALS